MQIEKVISYYQDCYKQEFRGGTILNYLGSKIEKNIFFNNAQELYQEESKQILNQEVAEELSKYIEIHKKEKMLIASSFFITGKLTFLGKKQSICSPLITTPVSLEISSEGMYYFKYNFKENKCNETLLNIIKSNFNLDDTFILEIKALIQNKSLHEQDIIAISEKLKKHIQIDSSSLQEYPSLLNKNTDLKKLVRKETLSIAPAISVGIVEKSKSNRGVLNEIDEIKESYLYNEISHQLFSKKRSIDTSKKSINKNIYVPSNLSEPQLNVIRAVKSSDINVVIGPPGTGKSYTIASLAIDMAFHNQKILICSKSDQAVNVIQDKIIHDLGIKGLSIRVGSGRNYKSKLKKKIDSILSSKYSSISRSEINYGELEIKSQQQKIKSIEKEIKKREVKELKNGELFTNPKSSFFKNIKRRYVSSKVLKDVPFWQLIDYLNNSITKKNKLIKNLILQKYQFKVFSLLKSNRKTFQDLSKLISTINSQTRESLFHSINFETILECLPIWITKTTDVSTILPLKPDIFDIVIIDEASQCDIATMIPVLVRAKKIVVVGDPKQLNHVSFLSGDFLQKTADTYGLIHDIDVMNYRKTSFLDYVLDRIHSQENIHFLDEHYRSLPSIINYSNQKFYDDRLKVMSDLFINKKESALTWIDCKGKKGHNGVNIDEANNLLKHIQELITLQKNIPMQLCSSIGILSPFRDQTNYLKKRIEKFNIVDIKKHKIAIGTPYEFQGEERDIMYISYTIDNNTNATIFQYLDREDVFNVSITRAKQKQYLYYSFDPKNFKNKHLLIDYFSDNHIQSRIYNDKNMHDDFSKEVYRELINFGINEDDILVNYVLAGHSIDIILNYNNKVTCIDLVGYPGEMENVFSIDQYKTLFRSKISIMTIPYAYWLNYKDSCLNHIKRRIAY